MFLELYLVAKRIECTNAIERGTADADAYFTIAFMCEYGVFGMSLDTQKALEYYTVAAAQGLAIAQCNLGKMYMKGEEEAVIEWEMLPSACACWPPPLLRVSNLSKDFLCASCESVCRESHACRLRKASAPPAC